MRGQQKHFRYFLSYSPIQPLQVSNRRKPKAESRKPKERRKRMLEKLRFWYSLCPTPRALELKIEKWLHYSPHKPLAPSISAPSPLNRPIDRRPSAVPSAGFRAGRWRGPRLQRSGRSPYPTPTSRLELRFDFVMYDSASNMLGLWFGIGWDYLIVFWWN